MSLRYSLITFSMLVQEGIKKKEDIIKMIKNNEITAGNDLYFPNEILNKLGNDPEFSTAEYWRISTTIKKLGLKKTIRACDWAELEVIELTAKINPFRYLDKMSTNTGKTNVTDLSLKSLYQARKNNLDKIERLLRWCLELYYLEKNINELAFYDKCLSVGELLIKKDIKINRACKIIASRRLVKKHE